MSSIKLAPNASGTGEFTIAAPNSNTNRTLTLPDVAGTFVTADASGNVGIGTSSPAGKLHVVGNTRVDGNYESNASPYVYSWAGGTSGQVRAGIQLDGANNTLVFLSAQAERARINADGSFLYRCTAVPNVSLGQTGFSVTQNELVFSSDTGTTISYWRTSSGAGRFALSFWNGTSNVGNIALNTTSTTYNTSSDYRLKHDIAPMTGALARVAALKPVTYKWNVDNSDGEGFIAHELAEVCPQAVTGEKDAVDADGNPIYQGIDTSFLVATLTAAIQEQQAMIQTLTARIEALEAK